MAILKPKQRMWLAIVVVALSGIFLLGMGSYVGLRSSMNLFGGLTVGTIIGILDLLVAYFIFKRQV